MSAYSRWDKWIDEADDKSDKSSAARTDSAPGPENAPDPVDEERMWLAAFERLVRQQNAKWTGICPGIGYVAPPQLAMLQADMDATIQSVMYQYIPPAQRLAALGRPGLLHRVNIVLADWAFSRNTLGQMCASAAQSFATDLAIMQNANAASFNMMQQSNAHAQAVGQQTAQMADDVIRGVPWATWRPRWWPWR